MSLNPPIHKIGSADLTNVILLDDLSNENPILILSTGMSTEDDIDFVIRYLENKNVTYYLLHCHSAYPAPLHHLNLPYIANLINKTSNFVGYSSHDVGFMSSVVAYTFGARIFAKHIILDKSEYGNDNHVSLEPAEFTPY